MASLPNADKAFISREKIENYLLSIDHPEGRGKALLFARFGFARSRWMELRNALLEHARKCDAEELGPNAFGTKFLVSGPLWTPRRTNADDTSRLVRCERHR